MKSHWIIFKFQLDIYKLKTSKQQPLNFRLYDCRGLEEEQSLNSRDVEAILDGHVLHDYVVCFI